MHSTSTECSAPDKQQGSCTLGSQPSLAAAPHQGFCSSAATDISSCTATGDLRAKHKRLSRQNKALVVQAPAVAASESLVPADLEWAHQMGYYVGKAFCQGHEPALRLQCLPYCVPDFEWHLADDTANSAICSRGEFGITLPGCAE